MKHIHYFCQEQPKKHIPTMTTHATVAVELDQASFKFIDSEKGNDGQFSLLQEKECDKCATDSPMLFLLRSPKHKCR